MATRRIQCTIDENLAARMEESGLSPSAVLAEALQERLGDKTRKLRPLSEQLADAHKKVNRQGRSLVALNSKVVDLSRTVDSLLRRLPVA